MQPLGIPNPAYQIAQAQQSADDTGFRVGTVLNYAADGSITVSIGDGTDGTGTLVAAAYMSNYFPSVGDIVLLGKMRSSWIVFGSFGGQQSRLVPATASVSATESTTSTSYTDLATAGPSVDAIIGDTGRALVTVSCVMFGNGAGVTPKMTFAMSGANTYTPTSDIYALVTSDSAGIATLAASRTSLLSGLTRGTTTFTAKYLTSAGTSTFGIRSIVVVPY